MTSILLLPPVILNSFLSFSFQISSDAQTAQLIVMAIVSFLIIALITTFGNKGRLSKSGRLEIQLKKKLQVFDENRKELKILLEKNIINESEFENKIQQLTTLKKKEAIQFMLEIMKTLLHLRRHIKKDKFLTINFYRLRMKSELKLRKI